MSLLRLKEVLKEKGVSSLELSEKIKLSKTSISQILNENQQPRFETLLKIAMALDVDVRDLFNPTKTNQNPKDEVQNVINQLQNLKDKL